MLRSFSAIFCKGDNFCVSLFAFLPTKSLLKNGLLFFKRKKLLPSKFFHFRVDPFSEGDTKHSDEVASQESVSVPLNHAE